MAGPPMDEKGPELRSQLRTPGAAAVAGIIFSLLLTASLVLLKVSVPADPSTTGRWLGDSGRRSAVSIALGLVPFAGIAFLWFIGVVRDRIGQREDRFFATVFLGSGLLFVAMLFVAAAFAGGLIAVGATHDAASPGPDTLAVGRRVTSVLLNTYAMRMAAVFTVTTVTIALRTRIMRGWLGYLGYAVALVLLFAIGLSAWVELLFPAWIFVLSVDILAAGRRGRTGTLGRREGP
jgi:hypothetical protein